MNMFGFYIGVPAVNLEEKPHVYLTMDGYGETLSGATRDEFIKCGINEMLAKHGISLIGSGDDSFIKYTEVKDCLEKIRYVSKIYRTGRLWIDEAITEAIKCY